MSMLPGRDEKYIALADIIYPAGANFGYAYNKVTQKSVRLTKKMAAALKAFGRFTAREEYLRGLSARGYDPIDIPLFETAFQRLVEEGLVGSRGNLTKELLRRGKADPDETSQHRITTVAWITRNRSEALLRSVRSFSRNFKEHERTPRIAVFDDTDKEADRAGTVEGIRKISRECGLDCAYAGPTEKQRFIAQLSAATKARGVPPHVVAFALSDPFDIGHSTGANRNTAMLATAGEMMLSLDDDIICEFSRPPTASDSPRITSVFDPTSIHYYPDRDSMLDTLETVEQSALGIHEEVLGQGIPQWLFAKHRDASPSFAGLRSALALDLLKGRGKTVVSAVGIHGDSGLGNPLRVVEAEGEERDRVMDSAEIYRSAATSREVRRAVPSTTVGRCRFLMGYAVGYDNRSVLPPFVPVGRNQDGIFQQTLQSCFQDQSIAYLPFTILHDPPDLRTFDAHAVQNLNIASPQIFTFLIRRCESQISIATGPASLRRLGTMLSTIGALKPTDFQDLVNGIASEYLTRYVARLEEMLAVYNGSPTYWAEDTSVLASSIENKLSKGIDVISSQKNLQDLVKGFGELLMYWPTIIETAQEMHESGHGPLVTVLRR
jgi:hypothetical protein